MYSNRKPAHWHREQHGSFQQRPIVHPPSQHYQDKTDALFNKKFTYVRPENNGRELWELPKTRVIVPEKDVTEDDVGQVEVESSVNLDNEGRTCVSGNTSTDNADLSITSTQSQEISKVTECVRSKNVIHDSAPNSCSHAKASICDSTVVFKPEVSDLCDTILLTDAVTLDRVGLNEKHDTTLECFDKLLEKKKFMNHIKESLSDKDIGTWHEHTGLMNLAGSIQATLQQWIKPQLCTQAWCKFYEILSSYPIVPLAEPEFHSVHLCEAPGAFVTSLNNFLINRNYQGDWAWLANTLNPYYESNSLGQTITDDRFLRFSLDNWCFGADDTGDIMCRENFDFLRRQISQLRQIHLVTADGSIDCQSNPGEQETVVSALHYCEVTLALHILSPGGALVVKYFTMYEQGTVSMMFLLACLFNQVHVFKPATSKSGNSEVYVICEDYQRHLLTDDLSATLIHCYDSQEQSGDFTLFKRDEIPVSFLKQHMACVEMFSEAQCNTIKTNLNKYGTLTNEERADLDDVREYCARRYISQYGVESIPFHQRLTQTKPTIKKIGSRKRKNSASLRNSRLHGSFNERVDWCNMEWRDKVTVLKLYDHAKFIVEDANWIEYLPCASTTEELSCDCSMCWGRPLTHVLSSRFCNQDILKDVQEMLRSAKVGEHRVSQLSAMETEFETSLKCILAFLQISMNNDVPLHLITTSDHMMNVLRKANLQNHVTNCSNIHVPSGCKLDTDNIDGVPYSSLNKEVAVMYFLSLCGECPPLINTQHHLPPEIITQLCDIYKHMENSDCLLIMIPVSLTRLLAGLLYLLYTSFTKMTILPEPAGLSLAQFVVLSGFHGNADKTQRYLHEIADALMKNIDDARTALLEIVPITEILADDEFVSLVTESNNYLLESFFNTTLLLEKRSYSTEHGDTNG